MHTLLLILGYGFLLLSAFVGYLVASLAGGSPTTPRWGVLYTNAGILLAFIIPLIAGINFTLSLGQRSWIALAWLLAPVAAGVIWIAVYALLGALLGR